MKVRPLAFLVVAMLVLLSGCTFTMLPQPDFTVTANANRPPMIVRLEYRNNLPSGGVYSWHGPWGVVVTIDQNYYEHYLVNPGTNPVEFRVVWSNGARTVEPAPAYLVFNNLSPIIVRRPTFTPTNWNNDTGFGQYLDYLQSDQVYVVDLRYCAEDPDGDKVTVKQFEVWTFHKPGYRPPQFTDAYNEIIGLYERGDYVVERDNAYYFLPYVPNRICWRGVDGLFAWQPRLWWRDSGNGLPYAPYAIDPAYPVFCGDIGAGTLDLPTGGAVIKALFADGYGGETWGEWVFVVSPTSCG